MKKGKQRIKPKPYFFRILYENTPCVYFQFVKSSIVEYARFS